MNKEEQKHVSVALRLICLLAAAQEEITPEGESERRTAVEKLDALLLAEDCLRMALAIPDTAMREEVLHVDEPWANGVAFGTRGETSRVRRILKAARSGALTGEKWKK